MTIRLRTALMLTLLAALAPAGVAAAKPLPARPPARVQIGQVELVPRPHGAATLLVPVLYPIQYAGRVVRTRVAVFSGGRPARSLGTRARVGNGRVRRPERRRRFLFVHRFPLGRALLAGGGGNLTFRVAAGGPIDVNRDGKPEIRRLDHSTQHLRGAASPRGLCSSIPSLRLRPGRTVSMPLPICDTPVRWEVFYPRLHGAARIRRGHLVYRARRRFRGSEVVQLLGTRPRQAAGKSDLEPLVVARARVTVGSGGGTVVRAIGDSVTAGFGYYSDGRSMTIGHLLECRPGEKAFDDACSSNSLNRTNRGTKVEYAPDYGLSNNISWAAQWANEHGVTDYENLAISGSEPADWAPGGEFHETTARVESEDPDYVLMTMGANPLLSEMLFGVDNMGCAVYSDVFGGYRECVERAFAEVHLQRNLKSLYEDLVDHTDATIYLMQYHLAVPSTALAYSAVQIAEMGKLLNREIATIAGEVDPQRLQVVTPPHFNVGIDISPVYPSRYTCSDFGYEVDGPSVQSNPTQDELEVLHPLSFCEGPPIGQPWIISGDTGIHPSAAGYAQMAAQVPPPTE
jgi:lysophospholipase L1-like esterase